MLDRTPTQQATGARTLLVLTSAVAMLLALTSSPASAARSLAGVCDDPPEADYLDRDEVADAHVLAVDCLTDRGVVQGFANDQGTLYFPAEEVTRGQMARFVVLMLDEAGVALPTPTDQGFTDVPDDGVNADQIRPLAAAGIVEGTGEGRYEPGLFVTRGEMASLLVRSLAHAADVEAADLQGGDTPFTDLPADGVHVASIEGVHGLGISDGVSAEEYAPTALVRRDEMASFVARSLDAAVSRTTVQDLDGGALARTTFTFLSEAGRCMQVTAGEAWVAQCDPAPGETPLQLYVVDVDGSFSVVAGVVTDAVATVEVETTDEQTVEVDELVATDSEGLRAFATTRVASDVRAVVAYDADGTELDHEQP